VQNFPITVQNTRFAASGKAVDTNPGGIIRCAISDTMLTSGKRLPCTHFFMIPFLPITRVILFLYTYSHRGHVVIWDDGTLQSLSSTMYHVTEVTGVRSVCLCGFILCPRCRQSGQHVRFALAVSVDNTEAFHPSLLYTKRRQTSAVCHLPQARLCCLGV
jgi:hypothetical protein